VIFKLVKIHQNPKRVTEITGEAQRSQSKSLDISLCLCDLCGEIRRIESPHGNRRINLLFAHEQKLAVTVPPVIASPSCDEFRSTQIREGECADVRQHLVLHRAVAYHASAFVGLGLGPLRIAVSPAPPACRRRAATARPPAAPRAAR